MLTAILTLALAIWPFSPATGPGRSHSRAYHAKHLRHIQAARARRLSHHHAAKHPSLIER